MVYSVNMVKDLWQIKKYGCGILFILQSVLLRIQKLFYHVYICSETLLWKSYWCLYKLLFLSRKAWPYYQLHVLKL